jgi:hypothetical protein
MRHDGPARWSLSREVQDGSWSEHGEFMLLVKGSGIFVYSQTKRVCQGLNSPSVWLTGNLACGGRQTRDLARPKFDPDKKVSAGSNIDQN